MLAIQLLAVLSLTAAPFEASPTGAALDTPPLLTAEGLSIGLDGQPIRSHPFLGLVLDAGVPDGLAAGLEVNPLSFLRLQLSGLSNGVGSGVRVGVVLVAFPRFPVRPLIAADAGYVFGGAGAWALPLITDVQVRAAVSNVSGGFLNVHAGLELGSKTFALVLRGGLSWIDVDLGGHTLTLGSNTSVSAGGTSLRGFIPSARLGFQICFL